MPISKETNELAKDLVMFMQNKYGFEHLPKIKFINNKKNASNVLGMTGGYDQANEEIVVYISNRHPKDILRSLAHEMTHHVQKCEGKLNNDNTASTSDPNYIMHDEYLKKIEADAFERGNITFREWEATKKGGKQMNEEKKMPKNKVVKAHEKAKEAMPSFKAQYGAEKGEKIAYATMLKQAKKSELEEEAKPDYLDLDKDGDTGESMKKAAQDKKKDAVKENKEVEVNPALKNSHTYIPEERPLANAYNSRDEKVYQELLKKFGIKK
jgi:hypothetical protein